MKQNRHLVVRLLNRKPSQEQKAVAWARRKGEAGYVAHTVSRPSVAAYGCCSRTKRPRNRAMR
ncbi:hypothetical protein [Williamwhitmania taraxaci]|uniref:hypothetical protein n=1 Tax=Williamwhitmania taraxaci TaxID=1640674 RepID=UPI000B8A06BB|nr:hypothetical protein [Williamwhitmania taraxaci]